VRGWNCPETQPYEPLGELVDVYGLYKNARKYFPDIVEPDPSVKFKIKHFHPQVRGVSDEKAFNGLFKQLHQVRKYVEVDEQGKYNKKKKNENLNAVKKVKKIHKKKTEYLRNKTIYTSSLKKLFEE
jgi:hypothetical protein